ncbi:MAG: sigma-54 factor interaction protein [Planctomycetaceae bacterium]|nr:sigma-54 factor interaction protein [Planctomycetaceae bacterium]
MSHIFVVDDEPAICWGFREFLTDDGHTVSVAASAEEALRLTETILPDVVVLDVRLPGMDGLTAIQHLKLKIGTAPIVVITAFGTLDTAIKALQQGAFDYLTKPFDLDQAAAVVNRALAFAAPRPKLLSPHQDLTGGTAATHSEKGPGRNPLQLVGTSPAMQRVFKQMALVADADMPVLITGESGTGKELIAKLIHQHSQRHDKPFLPVSLPALNTGLIESELFGHVRGAFTGATEDRRGVFEFAESGTLFLDEIADTPLSVQVKLLRALENHEFAPVGDPRPRPTRARILAATNRTFPELIAAGVFREDLYYRLSVFQIHLPPLRERLSDLPALAEYFLTNSRTKFEHEHLTAEFLEALQQRSWAGNVREFRNAMEYATLLARGGPLRREHLPPPLPMPVKTSGSQSQDLGQIAVDAVALWAAAAAEKALGRGTESDLYDQLLQIVEPPLIRAAMTHCQQNRAASAQLLGLHRGTLRQKLKQYEME